MKILKLLVASETILFDKRIVLKFNSYVIL